MSLPQTHESAAGEQPAMGAYEDAPLDDSAVSLRKAFAKFAARRHQSRT